MQSLARAQPGLSPALSRPRSDTASPSRGPPGGGEYGRRTLLSVIDKTAKEDPTHAFIYAPVPASDMPGGYRWDKVTFKDVANAVNQVAHDLIKTLGVPAQNAFPTLAYIGPNDMRYPIFTLGCVKAGYKAFLVSPRNSIDAAVSLFKATDCHHIFYADQQKTQVQKWLKAHQMKDYVVPSIEEMLQANPEQVTYNRAFEDAQWDPLVVLHTSGSTGIPKPITVRQGSLAVADKSRNLPEINGSKYFLVEYGRRCKRLFRHMPMFHAATVYGLMAGVVYYGTPMALGPPDKPLTAQLVIDSLEASGSDACVLPPSIIEDMSQRDDGLEALEKQAIVMFGGGPLSPNVGDMLAKRGVKLQSAIASTEFYPYPMYFQTRPELWNYFVFNSKAMGASWRPLDGDPDVYELVVVRDEQRRKEDGKYRSQPAFYTFPDKTEWSTADLYSPHPEIENLWTYRGRYDNIIVLSNGEKLNPSTIEDTISGHARVAGTMVVGQQRFQPAMIIEPVSHPKNDAEAAEIIDDVWTLVKQVNKQSVAHGQISKELMALSSPDKPFPRSAKGSIQRALATQMYGQEIDELYERGASDDAVGEVKLDMSNEQALAKCITQLMESNLDVAGVAVDEEFNNVGIDSAMIIKLASLLRAGLKAQGLPNVNPAEDMTPKQIYANSSALLLARYMLSLAAGKATGGQSAEEETKASEAILAKYTANLPAPVPNRRKPNDKDQTVVITGTTGSLGAYMLDMCISSPRVSRVYALNRDADGGRARQPGACSSRGLATDFAKVTFVCTDVSKEKLGMPNDMYKKILSQVDRVIHNAWPVNFNLNVRSFEPSIRGVRNIIDMVAAAEKRAPIVYLSSISSVGAWQTNTPVPEEQYDDLSLAVMGYGRSKAISSLLLNAASAKSGVTTAVVRVGQVGGPGGKMGSWNKQEFFPSLIASGVHLGVLPQELGPRQRVDWLTIEDVATTVLEVGGVTAQKDVEDIKGYYHASNPKACTWSEMAKAAKDYYGGRIKKLVSLEEWVKTLEASATENADLEVNPSIKLLDSHRDVLKGYKVGRESTVLATERVLKASPNISKLEAVTPGMMQHWCKQWGF